MTSFCDDADTDKLLSIVVWNLTRFFSYAPAAATELVSSFYSGFESSWGDDFYHHEGAYRSAALMHYVTTHNGDREGFIEWAVTNGHHNPPAESLAYFREHYFDPS